MSKSQGDDASRTTPLPSPLLSRSAYDGPASVTVNKVGKKHITPVVFVSGIVSNSFLLYSHLRRIGMRSFRAFGPLAAPVSSCSVCSCAVSLLCVSATNVRYLRLRNCGLLSFVSLPLSLSLAVSLSVSVSVSLLCFALE